MSEEEKRPSDLTAFEAALAALAPRANRLDRERLMFLAGQASVAPADRAMGPVAQPPSAVQELPGDSAQPGVAVPRRWAWPTAFAAMTAVAASLLIMLLTQPSSEVVERPAQRRAAAPQNALAGAAQPGEGEPRAAAQDSPALGSMAGVEPQRRPRLHEGGGATYLRLRDQVLHDGVESWAIPVSPAAFQEAAGPVAYHEWLEVLLNERGAVTSARPTGSG